MRFSAGRRKQQAGGLRSPHNCGSVLIIVLWVAFGLVTLALYFANSMSLELRAADNGVASLEAEQAIEGAVRYVSNVLANAQYRGVLPETNTYYAASVPVGDATFWLIGRGDDPQSLPTTVHFGLVDEASKLNLNTATSNLLQYLPRMTAELSASILDWRDTDDTVRAGGAETSTYERFNPPYRCKNAAFETVEELRLVQGANLDLLFGEDVNLNGTLDPHEDDGEASPPFDDRNGRLGPGLLEYLTVYSREPTTTTNGTQRLNVAAINFRMQVTNVLQTALGVGRARQILGQLGPPGATLTSVLQFYQRSGMTAAEFALVEEQLRNPNTNGLVNVNTASEAVLACIPGIGLEKAASVVLARRSQTRPLTSVAWVKDVLDAQSLAQAGPFLTGRGYQVTADIAATGRFNRGYRRVKFVFDVSQGTPRVIYRQDLTHVGWALGRSALQTSTMLSRLSR